MHKLQRLKKSIIYKLFDIFIFVIMIFILCEAKYSRT